MQQRSLIKPVAMVFILLLSMQALAQKAGGVLRRANDENPPSASLHEEGSNIVTTPFVPVFNNLVTFDSTKSISKPDQLVPDLATSWSWSADNKTLTFKLRRGVKWHDGKPFSAADVKCTWDTVSGKRDGGWRKSPRKAWYANLQEIVVRSEERRVGKECCR